MNRKDSFYFNKGKKQLYRLGKAEVQVSTKTSSQVIFEDFGSMRLPIFLNPASAITEIISFSVWLSPREALYNNNNNN